MSKSQHALLFLDVDGVLNDSTDHEKLDLMKKDFEDKSLNLSLSDVKPNFYSNNQYYQEHTSKFFKFLFENKEVLSKNNIKSHVEVHGFVGVEKLRFLQQIQKEFDIKMFLISTWGVGVGLYLTEKDIEDFFEMPFYCNKKGVTFHSDIRLNFTLKNTLKYCEENNIPKEDYKKVKVLYLDDLDDFEKLDVKEQFEELFDVLFIHPKSQNSLISDLNKNLIHNHLTK